MPSKLRLLADSYDQPQKGHTTNAPNLKPIQKGELFDPVDQAEYDRLVESGAAMDPKREQEQRAEEIERRQAQLEAERDALNEELKGLKSGPIKPERLSAAKLDEELTSRDLSTEGSKEEKQQRLAAALVDEQQQQPQG
jgi:hypothetical protein